MDLLHKLHDELKYDTLHDLRDGIARDTAAARRFHAHMPNYMPNYTPN